MNAPTLAPEIQQEAARSLLERLGEKTALVRFFRYNASAKHGVPIDPPATINLSSRQSSESTTTTPPPQPVQQPVQQPQATATISPQTTPANISVNLTQPATTEQPRTSNDFVKGVAIALASVAGIGGAAYTGYQLANRPAQPQVQQQAADQVLWPYSPLQFLEDKGEHLP